MIESLEIIKKLSELDFSNKGEAFVESRFLTPLLECLGYEDHNDYEVYRHGDEGTSLKLTYPPVEKGAVKVKHYYPDYIPTIRKKMFWVIEAKSPKSVTYPFDYKYLVQGLQYCIHPEIQAKYLVLSNGINTCIYDPQSAIFLNDSLYEPVFEFQNNELARHWKEIYGFLGVEKLRHRIEGHLKHYYEKLCLSSLDENYPEYVARKITKERHKLKQKIYKHVAKLYMQKKNYDHSQYQDELSTASLRRLEIEMEYPAGRSMTASQYYVDKLLKQKSPEVIFNLLITKYDKYSYFQKEHCIIAICHLHRLVNSEEIKDKIRTYILKRIDEDISPLNKAESALLRIVRKLIVIHEYPKIREKIAEKLEDLPEIEKFVNKPIAQNYTYSNELKWHNFYFAILKKLNVSQLQKIILALLSYEQHLEESYIEASNIIPGGEREINGFEYYGHGDKIYTLKNIACNFGVITRNELEKLIGIGTPITERPSHSTGHTDRVSGGSADQSRHK